MQCTSALSIISVNTRFMSIPNEQKEQGGIKYHKGCI
jgi:hypothetical protein